MATVTTNQGLLVFTADDQAWAIAPGVTVGGVTMDFMFDRLVDNGTVSAVDGVTVGGDNARVETHGAGSIAGTDIGVLVENAGSTIVANQGSITGASGDAIEFGANSAVSEAINSGTISSTSAMGIEETGGSATIDNSGMISGLDGVLSDLGGGHIALRNTGTISGQNFSIELRSGHADIVNLNSLDGSVSLSDGDDTIQNAGTITGNVAMGAGADHYDGRGGAVTGTVRGEDGNDQLHGGSGRDALSGGDGSDGLAGSDGDDVLNGNGGADILVGGQGADKFVFSNVQGSTVADPDIIRDFHTGQGDLIDLHQIDADTDTAGDQAFTFIGTHAFSGHAGELRYDNSTGISIISGDVNGDGVADFAIRLGVAHHVVAQDFIL